MTLSCTSGTTTMTSKRTDEALSAVAAGPGFGPRHCSDDIRSAARCASSIVSISTPVSEVRRTSSLISTREVATSSFTTCTITGALAATTT